MVAEEGSATSEKHKGDMMTGVTRRGFLRWGTFAAPFLLLWGKIPPLLGERWERSRSVNYWRGSSFHQTNLEVDEGGLIRAKINGSWREFKVRELSAGFLDWNFKARLETIDALKKGNPPSLAGPHSAAVATYGGGRLDSHFTVNNAVKGMGFVPTRERIGERIEELKRNFESPMPEKLELLSAGYRDRSLWDRTTQVSLELYTTPGFETHTFLNLLANPVASVVFLDYPSYELRALVRMVHPEDRLASQEEGEILEYTNLVHSFFHGKFEKRFIAMIFYLIEEFNNTPGSREGMGRRVVPPLELPHIGG